MKFDYPTGNERLDNLIKQSLVKDKIETIGTIEYVNAPKTAKKNKYGVSDKKHRTVANITFDSKKEKERYEYLVGREMAHEIDNLQLQVEFVVHEGFVDNQGNKHRPIVYIADFVYRENGEWIVEDVKDKHTRTQAYMIKKKLFLNKWREYIFMEV